jgi:RHS repeat-associated protein
VDPWGRPRAGTSISASNNRKLFTGHDYDDRTGYYYANARYYDPDTGRFLTQDSYLGKPGVPPSLHRYLYAYGNPARYTDPTGHCSEEDGWHCAPEPLGTIEEDGEVIGVGQEIDSDVVYEETNSSAWNSNQQNWSPEEMDHWAKTGETPQRAPNPAGPSGDPSLTTKANGEPPKPSPSPTVGGEDQSGRKSVADRRVDGMVDAARDSVVEAVAETIRGSGDLIGSMPPFSTGPWRDLMRAPTDYYADQFLKLRAGVPTDDMARLAYQEHKFGTDLLVFGLSVVSGKVVDSAGSKVASLGRRAAARAEQAASAALSKARGKIGSWIEARLPKVDPLSFGLGPIPIPKLKTTVPATPNAAMRRLANSRGGYIDPASNQWTPTLPGEVLQADHVYPLNRLEKLDGYKYLEPWQKDFLRNYPGNFESLPGAWNASKKDRLAREWEKVGMGADADKVYIENLEKRQQAFEQFAKGMIEYWKK